MILLLAAWLVIGAGMARAMSLADLDPAAVLAVVVASGVVWLISEGMRRSPTFSSSAVVGTSLAAAVGIATAVGWLDPLIDAVDLSPLWGHTTGLAIWMVALTGPLLGWWD